MRPVLPFPVVLKVALAALLLIWGWGFWWFYQQVLVGQENHGSTTQTDTVVVLTGGSGRVQYGLELLEAGRGEVLFITGVGKDVRLPELAKMYAIDLTRPEFSGPDHAIALGYAAGNTAGNARETAEWMRERGYQSLRLVTSHYHMPRSLMEFHAAMPDIRIVPDPVVPEYEARGKMLGRLNTMRLLLLEYHKFLVRAVWLKVKAVS